MSSRAATVLLVLELAACRARFAGRSAEAVAGPSSLRSFAARINASSARVGGWPCLNARRGKHYPQVRIACGARLLPVEDAGRWTTSTTHPAFQNYTVACRDM